MEISRKRYSQSLVIFGCVAIILFIFSPGKDEYPAAIVGIISFFSTQFLWPHCRWKGPYHLSPTNIALLLFGIQLILIPLLIVTFGPSLVTLPWLPSPLAINVSLLIDSIAYLSFCFFYQLFNFRDLAASSCKSPKLTNTRKQTLPIMGIYLTILYAVIGFVGVYFLFTDVETYINYLSSASHRLQVAEEMTGSLRGAISTLTRPFLGYSLVLGWSLYVDKLKSQGPFKKKARLITLLVVIGLIFVNITFSFNRAAVLIPLLGVTAVFSAEVRHLSLKSLIILGAFTIVSGLLWKQYILSGLMINDFLDPELILRIVEEIDLFGQIQLYGSSAHFLGYLLEKSNFGTKLYWGETICSSLFYPIPIIGKSFRDTSGPVVYNSMIYGGYGIIDQIIPFRGELFMNFHIPGVIGGYALMAYLVFKIDKAFKGAHHSFERYCWFIMGYWIAFSVIGGISIVSQIYVFLIWPIYFYLLILSMRIRI